MERHLQERLQRLHLQKQVLESTCQVIPLNQSMGEQLYQEGLLNPGVLDVTTPANWEVDQMQQCVLALQHKPNPSGNQRDSNNASDCTLGLQGSMIQYGKHIGSNSGCDMNMFNSKLNSLDNLDESEREKTSNELENECNNSMEYGEQNHSSYANSFLAENRLPLHWSTNSNAISSNGMMSSQHPSYHFLQTT